MSSVRQNHNFLSEIDDLFKASVKVGSDFTQRIINAWSAEKGSCNSNFADLLEILRRIDRFDVVDDFLPSLEADAEHFWDVRNRIELPPALLPQLITADDRRSAEQRTKLVMYDAFLLYADQDEEFVGQIVDFLTDQNMRLCSRNDLLGGSSFEHDAVMQLIANRCRRVIIIVSNAFLTSAANTFLSKYAQHIGIEQNQRKIVPCQKEECAIPTHLRYLFHLKYFKDGKLLKFWEKLLEAVQVAPEELIDPQYEYTHVKLPVAPPRKQREVIKQMEKLPMSPRNGLWEAPTKDIVALVEELPSPPSGEPSLSSADLASSAEKSNKKKPGWFKKNFKKIKTKVKVKTSNETSA